MNYKSFYSFFLERYAGSKKLRKIWYHGTSSTFLNSILKNGLKVDTKRKSWDVDEDSSFENIDRTSYGGVYLTTNLGTASSASYRAKQKFAGEKIIVISELQTKTLVSDEDDFSSFHKYNIKNAAYFYFLLKNGFSNSQEKREYITNRNKWISEKLNYILLDHADINPSLLRKIEKLLKTVGWFSVIQRATAYLPDYSFGTQTKEYPEKDKAEKDYRNFIDQLTKLIRLYPRKEFGRETGRSLQDISFSGSNKILAIVQMVENGKEQNYRTDLILLYGELPEKFIKDFKELYNPKMNVIDGRRK
jgi:hypothetical protein